MKKKFNVFGLFISFLTNANVAVCVLSNVPVKNAHDVTDSERMVNITTHCIHCFETFNVIRMPYKINSGFLVFFTKFL